MAEMIDPKLIDKRVLARNVKKGLVDSKDFERHLKALPDLASSAAQIEATIEATKVTATGSHPEED